MPFRAECFRPESIRHVAVHLRHDAEAKEIVLQLEIRREAEIQLRTPLLPPQVRERAADVRADRACIVREVRSDEACCDPLILALAARVFLLRGRVEGKRKADRGNTHRDSILRNHSFLHSWAALRSGPTVVEGSRWLPRTENAQDSTGGENRSAVRNADLRHPYRGYDS
jgi:hypothetical protein